MEYPKLSPKRLPPANYRKSPTRFHPGRHLLQGIEKGRGNKSGRPYVYRALKAKDGRLWEVRKAFYSTDHHHKITPENPHPRPEYIFSRRYKEKWAAVYVANIVVEMLDPDGDRPKLTPPEYFTDSLITEEGHFLFAHGDPGKSFIVDRDVWWRVREMIWVWHRKTERSEPRPHTITGERDESTDPWTLNVRWTGIEEFLFPAEDLGGKRSRIVRFLEADPRDYRRSAYFRRNER